MIRTLLRAPRGAELVADALRSASALSILVAAIGWGPLDAISILFGTLGTLAPRMIGVRPAFDIACCIAIPVGSWSSVLEIYLTTRWWDIPMHFLLNALLAGLLYLLLVQQRIIADSDGLPRPVVSTVVITTALGLALGVLWEVAEWFVRTFIDDEVFVSYGDSIGDLVVGGLGSIAAGFAMPFLAAHSRRLADAADAGRDGVRGTRTPSG